MSMDDQYREMKNFTQALTEFNMRLGNSMQELQKRHEQVSPHWQDKMRRYYDAQWRPLHDTIKHYVAVEGRSYVEFLHVKLHAMERYLHG